MDNGNPCLKVLGGDSEGIGIKSDVVTIAPGQPLHVSCRMRAAQKTHVRLRTVLMHAAHAEWPYTWTDADIGPGWTTVEGSGIASFIPGIDHAYLIFIVDGPGPVWLDDVQLRQDGSADPVPIPRAAVIADRHPLALYHDGEPAVLRLLSATPEGVAPAEIAWRVTGFSGEAVRSGKWRPKPGRDEKRLDCTGLPRGWYRGEVVWTHNGEARRNECALAGSLPPSAPVTPTPRTSGPTSRSHRPTVRSLRPSGSAGSASGRPTSRSGPRSSPSRASGSGTTTSSRPTSATASACAGCSRARPRGRAAMRRSTGTSGRPMSPPSWSTTGRTFTYGRSNEPSLRWWRSKPDGPTRADAHLDALKHSYPVIKRVSPTATVVGACTAGDFARGTDGLEFARELIADGGLNLMDALSFHYYHSYNLAQPMDEQANSTLDSTPRFREEMRAAGRDLPIINTEGGVYNPASCLTYRPSAPDNYAPMPADTVARLIVRMYVTQIASGVERFFLYNAFIDGSPVAKAWDSLAEGDGQPRPAVAAYAAMTWLLDGATFDRVDRPTDDLWLYRFTTPRGKLAVVWSRTGTATDTESPAPPTAGTSWAASIRPRGSCTSHRTQPTCLLAADVHCVCTGAALPVRRWPDHHRLPRTPQGRRLLPPGVRARRHGSDAGRRGDRPGLRLRHEPPVMGVQRADPPRCDGPGGSADTVCSRASGGG